MSLLATLPRDWAQELTEQTNLLLKEVKSHRAAGGNDDTEQQLEAACLQATGLSLKSVRASPPEMLVELINPNGQKLTQALSCADILCLDGEIQSEKGSVVNAIRSRLQALFLLVHAIQFISENDQAIYRPKLDSLFDMLSSIDDPYLQERLSVYKPS